MAKTLENDFGESDEEKFSINELQKEVPEPKTSSKSEIKSLTLKQRFTSLKVSPLN